MNVELINPNSVLGLFAHGEAAELKPSERRIPAWTARVRARVDEEIRYRRTVGQLRRLDDRTLDDLDIARAELPKVARARVAARAAQVRS